MIRPRISKYISAADAENTRQFMLQHATRVSLGPPPKVCRDESDDYLLALAVASNADYLVTRDDDLLVLGRHGKTEIIYPARFLIVVNPTA